MGRKLSEKTHTENGLIGNREAPESTLYGVQILHGIEDFRISKFHLNKHPLFIQALTIARMGAAVANRELDLLTKERTNTMLKACKEILEGKHHDQFSADMIQSGTRTIISMNINEVIANRTLEPMGHTRGEYHCCLPNDHVSRSQSTNDTYPTTVHIGLYYTHLKLVKHFAALTEAFRKRGAEFAYIIKVGRTQLEDAVPMTLGQIFNRFASISERELKSLDSAAQDFLAVNMSTTAIGTGITAGPEYVEKCIAALRKTAGLDIRLTGDLIGATSDTSYTVGYSSAMRRVAVRMSRVCNDLRLLASGPRCGLGEIDLPAIQPGSFIILEEVDPAIPGVMNRVPYKVTGNDPCVAMSGKATQMELNVVEPTMAQYYFESTDLLMNGFDTLHTLCVDDATTNEERCRRGVHNSIGVMTALNPIIGYKHSTKIAKEALETGKGAHELVLEHNTLSKEDLDTVLKPENMIEPMKLDIHPDH